jgi:hypothetical protein
MMVYMKIQLGRKRLQSTLGHGIQLHAVASSLQDLFQSTKFVKEVYLAD